MFSTWLSRSAAASGMPKPKSPPRPGRAPSGDETLSLLLRQGSTYDRALESAETAYTSVSLSRSDSDCRTLLRKSRRKRSFRGEDRHHSEVPEQARVIRREQSLAVRYSTEAQFRTDIKRRATRFYTSVIKQQPRLGGVGFYLYAGFGATGDQGSCARPPRASRTAPVSRPPPPRRRRHSWTITLAAAATTGPFNNHTTGSDDQTAVYGDIA